jgi:acyl-CoA carboxylase epsilon subunit
MTRPADTDSPPSRARLRVVRGDATAEEIAALVAILLARSADDEAPRPGRSGPDLWSDRAAHLRRPLSPGLGAWRRSGLPV